MEGLKLKAGEAQLQVFLSLEDFAFIPLGDCTSPFVYTVEESIEPLLREED